MKQSQHPWGQEVEHFSISRIFLMPLPFHPPFLRPKVINSLTSVVIIPLCFKIILPIRHSFQNTIIEFSSFLYINEYLFELLFHLIFCIDFLAFPSLYYVLHWLL